MRNHNIFFIVILFIFNSCEQGSYENVSLDSDNPLLQEWTTPFGVPPFDEIKDEHYYSAFQAAMAEHKTEVDAITNSTVDPTFANTIEALEYSGKTLNKVASVFFAINGAHSNDSIRGVARVIAPELSAHRDDITLNRKLFNKVKMVFDQIDNLNLDPQQRKLLEDTHKTFIRSGVNVKEEDQPRLREINKTLAELSQQFGQNLLAETNDFELHVTSEDDLVNLPENLVALAKKEAERREKEDGWVFTLSRPSINPFLQYSPNRDLREQIFNGYALRGDNNNEHDNKVILSKMAALRAERAKLMGYETHAHYVLSDNMAENPDRVYKLLDQIWEPALAIAKLERKAIEEMMKADGIEDQLRGSDWRYYTEKVRKARYDFDEEIIKPYFEVTAVREGAFVVANKLFGLTFEELFDLPKWHPEQQVFEVKEADGSHLGILYMDFFTRESKRGGAWMNSLRSQSKGISPIVTNNFNFPPPTDESPSLLSFTEAQTLFHEFGHALHGLFSKVIYESHSGTSVPRDFVEFPSQVMENWMGEPEVLRMFARHYETGEIIPDRLIDKISASGKFNQGFGTVEYMAASYLDMAWHTLKSPEQKEAREFEENHMKRIGLIAEIIPRYRSTYFAHIFNGGYSSGYYSYIWSEVLDADAFQAFKETDLFNQEMAAKYRKMLSQGGSKPGMELYEEFRGRQPEIGPLLEKRGLSGTN